jgi:glycerophosphoryl diester phosphodiesterase
MHKNIIFILFILIPICKIFTQTIVNRSEDKIIIAHRGASGYLPEHTMESKAMAYAMHPDFIEQDLVLSKDDVPIVIHDIYLDDITDVAQKFPDTSRNDNRFYVIDFTYDELKQLNVLERFDPKTKESVFPNRFPYGKSHFNLHSLQDEIELIQGLNKSTGFDIGIYPEIKNPKFHRENGKDISKIVLKVLSDYGYRTRSDNCILQCFDSSELKRIREDLNSELFLLQLIEFRKDENILKDYATYADGIGPWYNQIIKGKDTEGNWLFNSLVADAHRLGLVVHAYTFRSDDLGDFDSFDDLLDVGFNQMKLDGIFTDFPDKSIDFLHKSR